MNNELALQFENHIVRTVVIDGAPWWVLADVCAVLELANPRHVAGRLDNDEKSTVAIDDGQGGPERTIVSEPGLYKLLQTSRKPQAKRFDRWVRHEVLPTIRKTGGYSVATTHNDLIESIREIVRPLAGRFDGQDVAIDRMERRQNGMAEDLAHIKFIVCNGRRKLSEMTKREHVAATFAFGGRCPCCSIADVVSKDGKRLPFSEFDHFYINSNPSVDATWLICKPCNQDLATGKLARDQIQPQFLSYQEKRRRLPGRQPRLF
jgi:prophage antirepressor-like protein